MGCGPSHPRLFNWVNLAVNWVNLAVNWVNLAVNWVNLAGRVDQSGGHAGLR
jgi:hypothetical protein